MTFWYLAEMAEPINRDNKGRIVKGTGGRPEGAKNHLTTTVKQTVLAVFNDLQTSPKHSLKAFAKKYPRDFYNIAAKLIPTEITGAVTTYVINEVPAPDCLPMESELNGNGQIH